MNGVNSINSDWGGGVHRVYHGASHGTVKFDKSKPYVSTQRGHRPFGENHNATQTLPSGAPINCRYIFVQWLKDMFTARHSSGKPGFFNKPIFSNYSGAALKKRVSENSHFIAAALQFGSEKHYGINNDELGKFLWNQFEAMEPDGDVKVFMHVSGNHVMGIRLQTKISDGVTNRVLKFFDPNSTGTEVRVEADSQLEALAIQDLSTESFLGVGKDSDYFDKSNASVLTEIDPAHFEECLAHFDEAVTDIDVAHLAHKSAKFAGIDWKYGELNPAHIYFMLQYNAHENLAELSVVLKDFPQEKIKYLLAADMHQRPGLQINIQLRDHSKSFAAYKKLLGLLTPKNQIDLLKTVTSQWADQSKNNFDTETVMGYYKEVLNLVPEEHRKELLVEMATDATAIALKSAGEKEVEVSCGLLKLLPEPERSSILEQNLSDAELSFRNGDAQSFKSFGKLCSVLPKSKQLEFLSKFKRDHFEQLISSRHDVAKTIYEYGKWSSSIVDVAIKSTGSSLKVVQQPPVAAFKKAVQSNQIAYLSVLRDLSRRQFAGAMDEFLTMFALAPNLAKLDHLDFAEMVRRFDSSSAAGKQAFLELLEKCALIDQFIEFKSDYDGAASLESAETAPALA
ncbi:tetratricopeptide (TPR) repeat protein [Oxalobacteraceae bacterium GrIS 2.11]